MCAASDLADKRGNTRQGPTGRADTTGTSGNPEPPHLGSFAGPRNPIWRGVYLAPECPRARGCRCRNGVTRLAPRDLWRCGALCRCVTPRNRRPRRYAGYGNVVVRRNAGTQAGRGPLRRYAAGGGGARRPIRLIAASERPESTRTGPSPSAEADVQELTPWVSPEDQSPRAWAWPDSVSKPALTALLEPLPQFRSGRSGHMQRRSSLWSFQRTR